LLLGEQEVNYFYIMHVCMAFVRVQYSEHRCIYYMITLYGSLFIHPLRYIPYASDVLA